MVTKKITFLLLASLIVSHVGCSGSRLRNMVGRSEYSSLEEMEEQDADGPLGAQGEAVASDSNNKRTGSLVSATRELDPAEPADPVVKQKQRKGFFDFAKVFNRKSDVEEFAPDPFSEAKTSPEVKTASVVTPTKPPAEKKQVSTEADKFSSTISAVEKQAETIFEESLAKSESALFETEPSVDGDAIETDQKADVQSPENSFADFVREKADANPVVANTKQDVATAFQAASSTKTVATDFDAFLSDTADTVEQTVPADTALALFPGLSEEFDAAFEQRDDAGPTETDFADFAGFADGVESTKQTALVESTFTESAQKHGFDGNKSQDPWAAFGQGQTAAAQRRTVADSTKEVDSRNGFAWGSAAESAASNKPVFNLGNAQHQGLHESPDPTFLRVSSTRSLEPRATVEVSHSMPLMIPGAATSSSQSPAMPGDPFLSSVPVFEEVDENLPAELEVAAAVPTVATAEGGLSQWSRRTWFLLIGCLIVAMLLFMPDRHNRTNS